MVSYRESSIDQIIINKKNGQSRKKSYQNYQQRENALILYQILCKEIYGQRSGEFIGGSWGLKGL